MGRPVTRWEDSINQLFQARSQSWRALARDMLGWLGPTNRKRSSCSLEVTKLKDAKILPLTAVRQALVVSQIAGVRDTCR